MGQTVACCQKEKKNSKPVILNSLASEENMLHFNYAPSPYKQTSEEIKNTHNSVEYKAEKEKENSLFGLEDEYGIKIEHKSNQFDFSNDTSKFRESKLYNEKSLVKLTKELSATFQKKPTYREPSPSPVPLLPLVTEKKKSNLGGAGGGTQKRIHSASPIQNTFLQAKEKYRVPSATVRYISPLNPHQDDQELILSARTKKSIQGPKDITRIEQSSRNKHISVLSINESLIHRKQGKMSQLSSARPEMQANKQNLGDLESVSEISNYGGGIFYDRILNNNLGVFNNNNVLDQSIIHGDAGYEKLILNQSSIVNGVNYPCWSKIIHEDKEFYLNENVVYKDLDYKLESNIRFYPKRLIQIQKAEIFSKGTERKNICQGRLKTCSLISALIGIANYEEKNRLKVLPYLIFPQKDGLSTISSSGKYGIQLYFNGTRRLVQIDDILLFERKMINAVDFEEILVGSKSKNSCAMWICLFEKSVMKLYNTINQIDSNPALESFHAFGWIPEIIKIKEMQNGSNLWSRLVQNFEENNILLTIGIKDYNPDECLGAISIGEDCYKDHETGYLPIQSKGFTKFSITIISKLDLVFGHSYTVLSIAQIKNLQCAKIKNPWGHSPSNTFKSFIFDEETKKEIFASLEIKNYEEDKNNGISIILWEDIYKFCSSIYLNWNPGVYPFKKTIHTKFATTPSTVLNYNPKFFDDSFCLENFPQFLIKIPPHDEDFEVRMCFEKHRNSMKLEKLCNITYKLFSYDGDRIVYPNEHLRAHPYYPREVLSDVFIFEASKEYEYYVLVLFYQNSNVIEDLQPQENDNLTLYVKFNSFKQKILTLNYIQKIFSFIEIEIIELPFRTIQQRTILEGIFDSTNSAGNILSPNFLNNPIYLLNVRSKNDYQFKIDGPNNASLMILIVPVGGIDITTDSIVRIPFQNFLKYNPGFYFEGFSSYKMNMDIGSYLIIISNQNRKLGKYTIFVESLSAKLSQKKLEVLPLTELKSGIKFTIKEFTLEKKLGNKRALTGFWTEENSKGTTRIQSDSYQIMYKNTPMLTIRFLKNPGYIIKVTNPTKFNFSLKSLKYNKEYQELCAVSEEKTYNLEPPSLCICIFEIESINKFNLILEDENYAPSSWGFVTKTVVLHPNNQGYLLLCLNYEKGYIGAYELEVCSDRTDYDIVESISLSKLAYTYQLKGIWSKDNAGGCMSELNFYKNPWQLIPEFYEIETTCKCQVFIELLSPDPHPLCLSLFKSRGTDLLGLNTNDFQAVYSNAFLTPEMVTLRVSLKENSKYLLVASTFKPHQFGRFEIKIESSEELNVSEKLPTKYTYKKILNGEWNEITNHGSNTGPIKEFIHH